MIVGIDAVGIRTGGGVSILERLLERLCAQYPEWHFHLFVLPREMRMFDDPGGFSNLTVEWVSVGDGIVGRGMWIYFALGRRLKDISADVVLSFANIGSRVPHLPQVVYCQQILPFSKNGLRALSVGDRIRMKILKLSIVQGAIGSAAVIVQTVSMKRALLQNGLASIEEKIVVIPAGYSGEIARDGIRQNVIERVVASPRPRLCYVAHTGGHKNHSLLIRAIPVIRRKFPEVRVLLTLAPSVDNGGHESVNALAVLAKELGVEENVVWLGRLNSQEVECLIKSSDAMVHPSLAESFGLPLVEAMALGCPVVAADVEYAREILNDSGTYFCPYDPEALARGVMTVLGDSGRKARLIETGVERSKKFDYSVIAKQIGEVLRSVSGRER